MDNAQNLLAAVIAHNANSFASFAAARRLIQHFGTVQGLACASKEEMRAVGKISEKQAAALHIALELGREVCSSPLRAGERFSCSRELFHRYRARFFSARREHFFSLQLNSKNQLIREALVSVGSLNIAVVHPREVFSFAVKDSASALILLHNHPSGDPSPSSEDRDCTKRLVDAGKILGIKVIDHIVIGHDSYYSFADEGRIEDN
ncbi:MAG: DNA repair protein RadC [Acidobacteriota bacterium]|nr:DNA repair protein RadC [Acidobacteriota bacterium]